MPLYGENHSSLFVDETPHFERLDELDLWAANPPKRLTEVLKYYPTVRDTSSTGGKLLVCHDYKNGYPELNNSSTRWYTFNYWSYCDTFVYFSHRRVTIPPSGWITAAHRQGVKILGTLIFEGTDDILTLITGPLPASHSVSATDSNGLVALSPHYARVLADLAYQRGFDGYLLNFEGNLVDKDKEGRALASWITILQSELEARIGLHAQTIWYDSVTYKGSVSYQEKLDLLDLPFFIPSTGLFTDYHWANPSSLNDSVNFLSNLNPQDLGYVQTYESSNFKSLRDIFVGVDVWGRGTFYGAGFGCSSAIKDINDVNTDLSVAIFGPGWTWESTNKAWDDWFEYDKELWVGPNQDETVSPTGYIPFCNYFAGNAPPNPSTLAFYTSFCPGTGLNWYVNGVQVLQTESGWTDVQKQTSLGDLLWPQPDIEWDENSDDDSDDTPDVFPTLAMADKSWNGGNSLKINISTTDSKNSGRLPVQSITVTPGQEYTVALVYNTEDADKVVTLGLSLSMESADSTVIVTVISTQSEDLAFGWRELSATFSASLSQSARQVKALNQSVSTEIVVSVGLDISYSGLASGSTGFYFFLGQMTVFPVLPPALDGSTVDSKILWADFTTTTTGMLPAGVLTWDVTSFFVPASAASSADASSENTKPPWTLQDPAQWLPKFLYFNVYAQAFPAKGKIGDPEDAAFMGTSGLDGRGQRFFVDTTVWPDGISGASKARLYVQGVTDHGEVLVWDHCAYVDVDLGF